MSMSAPEGLAGIVLAAGLSRRYAGDKLLAPFSGMPLAAHVADLLATLGLQHRLAVCPVGHEDRAGLFEDRGFEIIWNDAPELGMGRSLALGAVQAQALGASAILVCLADMPNVTAAHLRRLIELGQGGELVATEVNGVRMPPAVFPAAMLPGLAALTGDRGARALLTEARTVAAGALLARDLDTRDDFR